MAPGLTVAELGAKLSLDDQMTRSLDKAERTFKSTAKRMDADAHIGLDTSDVDRELGSLKGKMKGGISDSLKGAGGGIDGVSVGLGFVGGAMVSGLAQIGATAAQELVASFNRTVERERDATKTAVQLGLPDSYAKNLGRIAGEMYVDGFGESTEQINETQKLFIQQVGGLGSMTESEFKKMIGQIVTVAGAFDKELGGQSGVITAMGSLMKNGLAPDAESALDLITRGLQIGGDKGDDLLETFNEYAPLFRSLGLDGQQSLGLINQALQAGAWNSDQIADGIKEFSIKAKDGTDTTRKALGDLGLDADQVINDIAAGGPKAASAFGLVLSKLREMKDPLQQSQTAVALFGPKAEDMQTTMNSLDPSKAVESLGQVEGAAQRVTDQMGDTGSAKIENFKREMTNAWDTGVNAAITGAATMWEKWSEFINNAVEGSAQILQFFRIDLPDAIDTAKGAITDFFDPLVDSFRVAWNAVGGMWNRIQIPQIGPFSVEAFGRSLDIGPYGPFDLPDVPMFDSGGRVPGVGPVPAILHGGEYVLPTHRMGVGAAMGAAGLAGAVDSRTYNFHSTINGAGGSPAANARANMNELRTQAFFAGAGA